MLNSITNYLSKNEQAEALALLDRILLIKSEDGLDDDLLAAKLRRIWRSQCKKQLNKIMEALEDMPVETHAGVLNEIENSMLKALGKEFAENESVVKAISKAVRKAYSKSKVTWLSDDVKVDSNNLLIDERAINFVKDNACFWIGEFYDNSLQPKVKEVMENVLEIGLDSNSLAKKLQTELKYVFGNQNYEYWDIAASSMLVRARAFGNVLGMEDANIKEYEIFAMLDKSTCRICREMDGRKFTVKDVADTCRSVMSMTNPDDIKKAMPWMNAPPIGISNKKLALDGKMMPPFHARCRCDIVMHEVKKEKSDLKIKKEILNSFPKNKKNKMEITSLDQDTRIALIKGNSLHIEGLPNWKYDLLDNQKDGIIKERRIYDSLGRVETEIHFTDHGNPSLHEKPHVHRSTYIDDESAKHGNVIDKSLISWEKEMVEDMPQEMLDKEGNWIWKKIKCMLSTVKNNLKKI